MAKVMIVIKRERNVEQDSKDAMNPVVTVNRKERGEYRRENGDERCVPVKRSRESLREQHLVGHVESHIGEERRKRDDNDAGVAKLRSGLNHLRQAQLGTLRRVKRHEHRAHRDAEHGRKDRPPQRET